MFSKLLKRKPQVRAPENPSVPEGTAVWAIGDIHGRYDLLKPLVEAITTDAASTEVDRKVVIFLGDYIDRGPDSSDVLRYLADLPKDGGIEWRFLKGNHEETMLDFLDDPSVGARWCEYGGDATLASYGLKLPTLRHKPEAWSHVSADLNHRLSDKERRMLEDLELSATVGDFFFVHAGARPGVDLDQQSEGDCLWIRRTFLDSMTPFERVVVHGHTPSETLYADQRRIGVDTKAYASGRLSAVRIIGASMSGLQTVVEDDGRIALTRIDRI